MEFARLDSWFDNPRPHPFLIAGPCGAESSEQLFATAQGMKGLPVSLFRAGVWKPRTRPDSFEGRGEEALAWLREIKLVTEFRTCVEVASATHCDQAMRYGIDAVWIGARTTVNPFSVQEIVSALKGTGIPVLIKNPVHADIQLWIGAIERFSNSGFTKIAAVHRGFHFYGASMYRNRPLWNIPIELKTRFPELPVICDPSHISGKRELVQQVAQEAMDLGMAGLMIETHYDPDSALTDAAQQISPDQLRHLLETLIIRKPESDDDAFINSLQHLRKRVDEIDEDLIHSIRKRMEIVAQIGQYKKSHHITVFQLERWQEILRTRSQWADKLGIPRAHIEKLCQLLHEESIRLQNEIMKEQEG
jgi:chorismate mutase